MPRLALTFGFLLASAFLLAGTAASASERKAATEAEALIAAVNELRAEHSLDALDLDPTLQTLSQDYALLMAENSCLAHDCAGRGQIGERARRRGYEFLLIGEALAGGPPEVGTVLHLWMMSEPHRRILLNDEVRHVGAGHVHWPAGTNRMDNYAHYWVLTVSLPP